MFLIFLLVSGFSGIFKILAKVSYFFLFLGSIFFMCLGEEVLLKFRMESWGVMFSNVRVCVCRRIFY